MEPKGIVSATSRASRETAPRDCAKTQIEDGALRNSYLVKNCSSIGARCFAFTLCVSPSRTWCWAFGRTCASASVLLWNHLGLLPPAMTSVGIVTELHRSAGKG